MDWTQKVRPPEHVICQMLGNDSILLDLETNSYFGLDKVGTSMWRAIISADSLHSAYEQLLNQYEVAPSVLQSDMESIVLELINHGLLQTS